MNEITLTMDRFMELVAAEQELMDLKYPKAENVDRMNTTENIK